MKLGLQDKKGPTILVFKGFALGAGLFLLATIAFFTLHLRVKNPPPGAASYAMITGIVTRFAPGLKAV
jgi:hypothetical protein